jgi:hypothetical protein
MGNRASGLHVIIWFGATVVCAAEPPGGADIERVEILKNHGLKALGPIYVVDTEADAKKKASEIKLLSKQWKQAKAQQESVPSPEQYKAMIQGLNSQISQLRAQLNTVNNEINRLPRFRGRFSTSYSQEAYAELLATRNQLNMTMSQQNALLGQLRGHPPDPKVRQKLDGDAQARHDEYLQAVHDLSQLVVATKDKYAALAKNDEVTKALAGLDPAIKPRPQLGPSHEFHELAKLADRLEKETAEFPAEPKSKATAKTKRGSKATKFGAPEDSIN